MKMDTGDTLLMIGDSITDCGREYPVGKKTGLGDGYVSQVWALLNAVYPESKAKVLNLGISGQPVVDVAKRWQEDVIDLKPDWVSILIGINDVWRHFDDENYVEQVDLETYEKTLGSLINKTKDSVKGIIIMSPYYIESNLNDPMRISMDKYSAASKRVAEEQNVIFVDIQAAFDRFIKGQPTQFLSIDRVHVNAVGHMIIARAFLNAMDFRWDNP